jgi:hypothetical protein
VNLVCPKCLSQWAFTPVNADYQHALCRSCKTKFTVRLVRIRAKNSRGNGNRRWFSVRVYAQSGREELIEFEKPGWDDFELRSKDAAVFSYYRNQLAMVQNLTVNRYISLRRPFPVAPVVVAVVIIAVLLVILYNASKR